MVRAELAWSDGSVTTGEVSPVAPVTGETASSVMAAVAGPLIAAIKGVPLSSHEEIFRRLQRAVPGNTTAKFALDQAVHARLGALFFEGLGGAGTGGTEGTGPRPLRSTGAVAGTAAHLGARLGPVRTDVTVSLGPPEAMAEAASERAREGFDVLKLKLGGGDVGLEVARVVAVSRAVGPGVALRLDANQAWTAKEALAVLDRLEREGIRPELVEQPVPARDLKGMAAVTSHGFVPVLADESVHSAADVLAVAEAGAADLVNVKLAKCGGLRAARDVVAVAEASGLPVIVGCMMEPADALSSGALLAMTLAEPLAHDLDALWWVGDGDALHLAPPHVVPSL